MRTTQHLFRFAEANHAFWDTQSVPHSDGGTIFVDIMHDNQWYIRWNLLTAKYLQKLYGGRIIALQHYWPAPLRDYRPDLNAVLATSYGVDAVINIDERKDALKTSPSASEARAISRFEDTLTELSRLNGAKLRRALLALEVEGNPDFGWLAYDTFIRSQLVATVENWSDQLAEALRETFLFLLTTRRLARSTGLMRCVLGHVEYMPYAFLGHEAIDAGGETYSMWPLVPGTLRAFRDRESLRQNKAIDFPEYFNNEIAPRLDVSNPKVQEFWAGFRNKFAATRSYKRDNLRAEAASSREAFLGCHGLDPNKRTVCLMSHALSDAVHANGPMVFDDFGQWLQRTLEMCEGRDDLNVMIKVHPRDRVYSRDFMISNLIGRFDYAPNISILPRTVENAEIIANSDAVVTVQGTPGYEMPLQGARSVIAGRARYSGLGIGLEPQDEDEYIACLLGRMDDSLDLSLARDQAIRFAYAEFNIFRAPTVFVRPDKVRMPPESPFWLEEAHAVSTLQIQDDPYFHAVVDMVENKRSHMLRTEFF